jgi:hypothetical protein
MMLHIAGSPSCPTSTPKIASLVPDRSPTWSAHRRTLIYDVASPRGTRAAKIMEKTINSTYIGSQYGHPSFRERFGVFGHPGKCAE